MNNIRQAVFRISKRFMHDSKLPSVTCDKIFSKGPLDGTQSPRKADYCKIMKYSNLEELINDKNKKFDKNFKNLKSPTSKLF